MGPHCSGPGPRAAELREQAGQLRSLVRYSMHVREKVFHVTDSCDMAPRVWTPVVRPPVVMTFEVPVCVRGGGCRHTLMLDIARRSRHHIVRLEPERSVGTMPVCGAVNEVNSGVKV